MSADAKDVLELDLDSAALVARMLVVGLSCYGELERLRNEFGILSLSGPLPRSLAPIDPTGDPTTISNFADALVAVSTWRDD